MTGKENILVLDNEKSWLSTIKNLLKDDYDLILTTSAEQARKLVKNHNIVLAILDQKLSKNQYGIRVLSKLRKDLPDLRAIILTGYPNYQDSTESFHAGALDYISKSEKNLKARLIESIERYKRTKGVRLFLSYQITDRKQVEVLYRRLEEKGFIPWMDINNTTRGKWGPQMQKAIKESDYFIPCFSFNSLRKKQSVFREELALALKIQKSLFRREVFIVPARLIDCEIPDELERFQYVDLFAKNGLTMLIKMLT